MQFSSCEGHSIVGDECHIISSKLNGPRFSHAVSFDELDAVENLILLCKIHHKLVDDHEKDFTAAKLRAIKSNHERWVDSALGGGAATKQVRVRFLSRITNGTQLANLIVGSLAYLLDNEHPESEADSEAIACFHQDIVDWGDLISRSEPSVKVRCGFSLGLQLTGLEEMGFQVFAAHVNYSNKAGNTAMDWPTLVLTVVRPSNPGITPLGELATVISPARLAC